VSGGQPPYTGIVGDNIKKEVARQAWGEQRTKMLKKYPIKKMSLSVRGTL
jgi:hypothetical protein